MEFSLLKNLQQNKEQKTLSSVQQEQLLKVVGRLLRANFNPHRGSLLIVRTWADGTFEKILAGNLMEGGSKGCYTQCIKPDRRNPGEEKVVNDACFDSATYVGREIREAFECDEPESFYYGRIDSGHGCVYAQYGHYVLSLPLADGRIIASFRAEYSRQGNSRYAQCEHRGQILSSANEAWQHKLMLTSLAKALSEIVPDDIELGDAFLDVLLDIMDLSGCLPGYEENEKLILRCLKRKRMPVRIKFSIENSKLPNPRQRYAIPIRMLGLS